MVTSDLPSYQYEPLLENQFRILEITAVHPEISCRLVTCVAGQTPSFSALSYAWGSEPNTKSIICDYARFLITSHLYECLVSIFLENGPTRLWVDAICINQSSDREKASQVAKMHRLYSNADLVYVWLGQVGDRSDEAMDAIRNVHLPEDSKSILRDQLSDRLLHLRSQAPKLFDRELFKPIAALSRRSWFKRLWVVQEYVLAKSVVFLCGRKTLDSRRLRDTLQKISIYSFGDGKFSLAAEEQLFEGYNAFRELEKIKENYNSGTTLTFFDYVMLGRSRLAKEPVDRIYAMLGLIESSDTIYAAKLPIDYSEENRTKYWRVYTEFGKIALQKEPHLRLLSFSSSDERPEGLPSWCPNLCSPATLDRLDDPNVYKAGWPWKDHLSIVGPDGCKAHPHFKSPQESHVTVRENSNTISIWGARLDNIRATLPKSGWSTSDEPNDLATIQRLAKGILRWFEESEKFCATYGKYEKIPSPGRTVWNKILTIANSPDRRPKPDERNHDEAKLIATSDTTASAESFSPDQLATQPPSTALDKPGDNATHPESLMPTEEDSVVDTPYLFMVEALKKSLSLSPREEQMGEVHKYISDFELFWAWLLFIDNDWSGRALFATKDGYLGCAPNDVTEGDVVCMLYGGRTMYVLREEEGGYRFIGEAYVYDCMDGQVFEMLDQGLIVEEEFSIF